MQAGPLKGIKVEVGGTRESIRYPKGYAFVQFLHEESVEYACQLMSGIMLYGKKLRVCPAEQQEPHTPSPMAARSPNGLPILQLPVNLQQSSAASVQGRPSPMHPPSGPLYSSVHPSSPQISGTSAAQHYQEWSHPHHPHLPSPLVSPPLLPPNAQHTSQFSPQGYIPVADGVYNGAFPWQQDGYPNEGHMNTQIHESRAYAHDHPPWLRNDVRQHLSDYHTSRLQGTLPQDDHRQARSRSPHRNDSTPVTHSDQHLSDYHTSRLQGTLPQDDHRRARSRSPHHNNSTPVTRSDHHLSDYHTSRLQGTLPQDDHRRARSRSPHRNNSTPVTRSDHHHQQQQHQTQQCGQLRRTYSYHGDDDNRSHANARGRPSYQRTLSHDGNQPIRSRDKQAYRYQGRH